jgi:hypothetical protein
VAPGCAQRAERPEISPSDNTKLDELLDADVEMKR